MRRDGAGLSAGLEQRMLPHIRIGITGHREAQFAGIDPDQLQARLDDVLATLAGALGDGARIEIITLLAKGADSMAAASAQARGWTVEAVLPFAARDYALDFAPGVDRDRFMADLVSARHVFALDGDRGNAPVAYERAGRVMLAQSDLLVALWDGSPANGPGGTGQIVAEAVALGIPVVHLDCDPARPARLLWPGLHPHDLGEAELACVASAGLDRLGEVLAALPGVLPDEAAALQPLWAHWALLATPYRLLLAVTRARVAAEALPEPAAAILPEDFAAADRAASEAAALFRGAFVANFALAAGAVLVSLSGLVLPLAVKPLLLAGELGLIGAILALTHFGRRWGWHRRWIEQRQLAERLRCLRPCAQLGDLGLRSHGAGTAPGVQAQVAQAARAIGLPDAQVDRAWCEAVRDALVALAASQQAYFTREAATMHRLEHRLHRAGSWLFLATAVVCIGFLGLEAAIGLGLASLPEADLHHVAVWVTIATAACPALGAAIYGIRMQGDFAGVAERSHAMEVHLAGLRAAMADEEPRFDRLLARSRRLTALLTEDLDNWTHAYEARPLVLPG